MFIFISLEIKIKVISVTEESCLVPELGPYSSTSAYMLREVNFDMNTEALSESIH